VLGFGYFPKWDPPQLTGLDEASLAAYETLHHSHHVWHTRLLFIAIPAGLGGLALGILLYQTRIGALIRDRVRGPLAPVFTAWKNKYWVDEIYEATFIAGALAVSRVSAWWDRNVIDGIVNAVGRWGVRLGNFSGWTDREIVDGQFVHGAAGAAWGAGGLFSRMQGGKVRVYVFQAVFTTAVLALVIAAVYG